MAWTTGTCVGHIALMVAVKTFLTAQGWTCLADRQEEIADTTSSSPSSTSHRTMYFKGTGLAGEDEVFIGLQDWQWSGSDVYNIALQGFTGFDSARDFWTQPGCMQLNASRYNFNLSSSNVEIKYWIIANGRRVIIVTRLSTAYCCAYLGLFLPYCRPNQYPYPLFVGGNSGILNTKYTQEDVGNCNFWWALSYQNEKYITSAYLSSEWKKIYYMSPSNSYFQGGTKSGLLYQFLQPTSYETMSSFLPNEDGSRWLSPVAIADYLGTQGVLDGVFHINASSANVEDIITVSGVDYLLVQNVYRQSENQFSAIGLV